MWCESEPVATDSADSFSPVGKTRYKCLNLVKCQLKKRVITGDKVDAGFTLKGCSLNSTVSQRLTIKEFAYLFDFSIKISVRCWLFLQNNSNEGPVSSLSCLYPQVGSPSLSECICEASGHFRAET